MFSHLSLGVNDFARARDFYDRVLAVLGHRRIVSGEQEAAYGRDHPQFWIATPLDETRPASPGNGTHIAFWADSRALVDAFHKEALAAGAQDAGVPGPRPQYGAGYYAAFVLDPEGHKIEVEFWDEAVGDG